MYFNLKRLLLTKLQRFLINKTVNETTNCRLKAHELLLRYQKTANYLTMIKSTLVRHAQTQHSDASFDLGNILLCKTNLFQIPELEGTTNHKNALEGTLKPNGQEATETETPESTESKNCVFFEVEENLSAETLMQCHKEKTQPLPQPNEKRKADDDELPKAVKKAKLDKKCVELKRPGFTNERYNETSYYIENGLRKVYPYYFTFTTFTKGRWVGEKILDVFSREFRAHPVEEYQRAIETGSLTVNYEKVPVDYRLKHNDLLANTVHRHEVPVTGQTITIVHMDDDIVVVNKPASIPVHPCGRYRHNTVVFILAKEYNLKNLRTIHRLDRLTSGLLLFGRSPTRARQLEQQIRNREVKKEYICRVEGEFPDGILECNEAIKVVSFKIGVCKVSAEGKDCKTTFERISYNGKTSVVLCKPVTGRMHQIRVHLQYLGFPVVNDPLYNHLVFGPLKGRGGDIGGRTDEELVRDLINIHNAENWLGIEANSDISMFSTSRKDCSAEPISASSEVADCVSKVDLEKTAKESSSPQHAHVSDADSSPELVNKTGDLVVKGPTTSETGSLTSENNSTSHTKASVATQTGYEFPDLAFNGEKMTFDKYCYDCKVRYRDPNAKDLVMYLHAWKYKGAGWEYETMLPNWASADWVEDN